MQNKHTEKALLESKPVQEILASVVARNNVTGGDIAPWSNGELQVFDKDPAPRAIASHVTVQTVKALKEHGNFNGISEAQLENGKQIADMAFHIESAATKAKVVRPQPEKTISELYIDSAAQARPLGTKAPGFEAMEFTTTQGTTVSGSKMLEEAAALIHHQKVDAEMGKMAEAATAATAGLQEALKASPHRDHNEDATEQAPATQSANEPRFGKVADLITPNFGMRSR